jgi:chorismate mutase
MSKTPPAPPSLEVLRKEIDAIDEQVHGLLMARGDIIDRLISVKQTQEVGSAFRPAREADMMRRLVQRHRGILPLDTVESIWRVIISTFTYVQAPFSVHADISLGESAMRDSARFHFGFTVPYVSPLPAALHGGSRLKPAARRRSLHGCRSSNAPTIPLRCRYSWCRAWPTAPW